MFQQFKSFSYFTLHLILFILIKRNVSHSTILIPLYFDVF